MAKLAEAEIPAGLRRVYRKLKAVAEYATGAASTPDGLWRAAVEAGREHGVFRSTQD
jgi:hypothetical protein